MAGAAADSRDGNKPQHILIRREQFMVAKCANPSCGASFQYLRGGKLFLVDLSRAARRANQEGGDSGKRTAEYFWLCDRCCSQMTVLVDESGQVAVARAGCINR